MTTALARLTGRADHSHDVAVIDERAARAAAGILLLPGVVAATATLLTGDALPLRVFGMAAVADFALRVGLGAAFAPSLLLGALAVSRQRPEWVGADAKRLAWALGLVLALVACLAMGWLGLPAVALALCGVCLTLLFLETAFGVCVGCALHRRFRRDAPQLCPGGACPR